MINSRILALLLLAGVGLCFAQRSGNELFQQALRKERSDGDLKGAIEIYQRVVKNYGSDRKLAARALLRIAQCQERQGSEQARRTYERLVKEFTDQTQEVAEARARIASLAMPASSSEPRARRLWAGQDVNEEGSVSPDGRWLTYAHWETGDLGLRDLVNGSSKMLTGTGGWAKSGGEFAQDSRFSPDGKTIAYNWFMPKPDGGYELRLMNTDGTNVRTLGWAGTPGYVVPHAWSADGKMLLAAPYDVKGLKSLYVVSVPSGEKRELIPPGRFLGFGACFSRDGKWVVVEGEGINNSQDLFLLPTLGGKPEPLVAHPAEDIRPVWSDDGRHVLFVSNRAGTFGLWRIPVENGKATGTAQLIRADLGGSAWPIGYTRAGALVYSVAASGQEIYSADFDPATGKVTGKPVLVSDRNPGNNVFPRLSPDGKRLAFFTQIAGRRNLVISIRDLETQTERTVSTDQNTFALAWRPDSSALLLESTGHLPNARELRWMDVATGQITPYRVIEPTRNALWPHISTDGKKIYLLLREWPDQAFSVTEMDVVSGQRKSLYKYAYETVAGGLRGLSLSRDGQWLATVRMGRVAQPDTEILLVPTAGGEPRVVANYRSEAGDFGILATFSPDGKYLILRRSRTQEMSLDSELLRVEISTGAVEPVGVEMSNLQFPQLHPSGRKIFFQGGRRAREIWVAENILPVTR
jgi:Tol biopolymer transport system component